MVTVSCKCGKNKMNFRHLKEGQISHYTDECCKRGENLPKEQITPLKRKVGRPKKVKENQNVGH